MENVTKFLIAVLSLGGSDVSAYSATVAAFGSDIISLTNGAAANHTAAAKGFTQFGADINRVYITAAGRAYVAAHPALREKST